LNDLICFACKTRVYGERRSSAVCAVRGKSVDLFYTFVEFYSSQHSFQEEAQLQRKRYCCSIYCWRNLHAEQRLEY